MHNLNLTILKAGFTIALQDKAVFTGLANNTFTGQINQLNDKVKLVQVGDIDINSYTDGSGITVQEVSDAALEIIADQDEYFAYSLDTLEFNNLKSQLSAEYARKAAYAANNSIDKAMAAKYADAKIKNTAWTNASPLNMTSLNVADAMLDMGERFADAGVPRATKKVAIIRPWVTTKLALDASAIRTENVAIYSEGYIGTAHGWDFVESNNVSVGTESSKAQTRIMFVVPGESMGYAAAVSVIESQMIEDQIGKTQVAGRFVYGIKSVRPDKMGVLYADKTAEA